MSIAPETPPEPTLDTALERLLAWFDGHAGVLVAYSGGVDSAVVLAAAHRRLGERVLACIGVSPSYPVRERRAAIALAGELGVSWRLIDTHEHEDDAYAANPANRCYYCKRELFDRLSAIAAREGWALLVDGTNADDRGDDRPGMVAAHERAVRSPLAELGLTKPQVRALARHLGLAVWDKPAMACLASRVPEGTPITPALLRRIERAEDVLVAHGFAQFRVRHHADLARIELPPADLPRALTIRAELVVALRRLGYQHVCLDLAGFRGAGAAGPADMVTLNVETTA